jgi:IS30 family transposase
MTTPAALRKTLALDNGKEFAEHEQLELQTALRIYFAHPYCAWQRGISENTNGLVRDFFPKGTDLASLRSCPPTSWGLSRFSRSEDGTVPFLKRESALGQLLPERRFTKAQQLLNDRPRTRPSYRSPNEAPASGLHPKGCD